MGPVMGLYVIAPFLGLTLEFPYIPMLSVLLQAPYSLHMLLFFLYKTSCGFRSQTVLVDSRRLYPGELWVTLMVCNSVVLVEDPSCYWFRSRRHPLKVANYSILASARLFLDQGLEVVSKHGKFCSMQWRCFCGQRFPCEHVFYLFTEGISILLALYFRMTTRVIRWSTTPGSSLFLPSTAEPMTSAHWR